jgi:NitT/TauT family transport system substrate-binding protein
MKNRSKNLSRVGVNRRTALMGLGALATGSVITSPTIIRAQTRALDIVKGTLTPLVAYAPIYCAIKEGFFAKYGIENQIDSVAITASLPIVARGSYDWGRSSNGPGYFNALNSGLAIRGVVDRLTYICSGDNGLVVSRANYNAGIRRFADLKGKVIGINARGTATDYWISKLLAEANMKSSDIRLVTLSYPDLLTAMSTGSADAGFLPEPLMTKGVMEGRIDIIRPIVDVSPGDNIGVIFFGEKFIEKAGGDLGKRWLMAYVEGIRFAQDPANRDAVLAVMARETRVEPDVLSSIYDKRVTWPQCEPNGRVDAQKMLDGPGQFFINDKQIDKLPPANRIFDGALLESALKEVGEVPANRLLCNV